MTITKWEEWWGEFLEERNGAYVYSTWKEDECVLAADEHQLLQLSAVCAYNTGEGAAAVTFKCLLREEDFIWLQSNFY